MKNQLMLYQLLFSQGGTRARLLFSKGERGVLQLIASLLIQVKNHRI